MLMKNLRNTLLLVAFIGLVVACSDDSEKEFCAVCNDDTGEVELCAADESTLEGLKDDWFNSSQGTSICVDSQ